MYGSDQFAYARVVSENTTDGSLPAATQRELEAMVDGEGIPVTYPRSNYESVELRGDFQGRSYIRAELRSGGTQAGYLVYGLSSAYTREDVRIRFEADTFDRDVPYNDLVVEWTA
jgi:hypothetical protein